jgi:hypothetical protein
MNKLTNWVKTHKLISAIAAFGLLIFYLAPQFFGVNVQNIAIPSATDSYRSSMSYGESVGPSMAGVSSGISMPSFKTIPPVTPVPPTDQSNRMIITDTNLSLMVKNVTETVDKIQNITSQYNGFLVNSTLSLPEGAASGTITIRVPATSLKAALETYRKLAVKVISENVQGTDITDQYADMEAQLNILNQTKLKFDDIMDKAVRVEDLLTVQRELINIQNQVDSIKGRQLFLEKSAQLSKVTIYLSTDELALPYAPDQAWRPQLVLKQAVRSLIGSLRSFGNLIIWLVVYSPIWAPIMIVYIWRQRRHLRNLKKQYPV